MSAYSGFKPLWFVDQIKDLREGKQIVPVHVQLILSDLCNQNCHFCAYRMDGGFSTEQFGGKNPNRKIPTEKALEILEDCHRVGVKAIQFTGGGEPTVHPDHIQIFQFAQDLGLKTGLVTNAVRIKRDFVYGGFEWARVSLDAGRKETYARIRESDTFDKVVKNISWLATLKPYLGVGFVVTKDNWTEIQDAAKLAKDVGAKYIRFAAVFSQEGSKPYQGIYDGIKSEIEEAKTLEDGNFKIVDLFGTRIHDLDSGRPKNELCGYQQFTTYIGGDLKVYRCCTTSYTKHGEVGDLSNQRFSEWVENKDYSGFNAKTCHHCQFNRQNELINEVMKEPMHAEFV